MNIEEYAWNKHEQQLKETNEFTYSSPKIKIVDNNELRNQLEETLEKLPQKLLAKWALRIAVEHLSYLDDYLVNDPRIDLGIETLEKRITGDIRAFDLRKIGFIVNELAKESTTEVSKYAARSFAQAIATGHMRGHAMVSSDYAVKLVNYISNNSSVAEAATKERERQLRIIEELI
ncbi:putative immunity protein [Paenibacillus sp. FSL K6-0276]|uniref:putative immunity protein n=1 Tax=Paenibacillus sp. FSL K6-0276 TaxID=2921450 RepID=UPI0030ED0ED1